MIDFRSMAERLGRAWVARSNGGSDWLPRATAAFEKELREVYARGYDNGRCSACVLLCEDGHVGRERVGADGPSEPDATGCETGRQREEAQAQRAIQKEYPPTEDPS